MSDGKLTFIRPNVLKVNECKHLEKNPQGLLQTVQAEHSKAVQALNNVSDEKARRFLLDLVGGTSTVKNPRNNIEVRAEASKFTARVQVTQYVINRASKMDGGLTVENLQKAYQEFQQRVKNDKHLQPHFDKIFGKEGTLKLDSSLFDYKRKIQVGKNKRIIWDHVELEILAPSGVLTVHGQCAKQLDTAIPLAVKNITNTVNRFSKPADTKPVELPPKQQEPKAEPEMIKPDFQPAFSTNLSTEELKINVPDFPEAREITIQLNGNIHNPSKRENEIIQSALLSAATAWLVRQAVPESRPRQKPPGVVPGDSGEPPAQPGPGPECPSPQPAPPPVVPAPGNDGSPPAGDCTIGCPPLLPDVPSNETPPVASLPVTPPSTGGENPLTGVTIPMQPPPAVTPSTGGVQGTGLTDGENPQSAA